MKFAEVFLTERPQDGLDAVQSRLRKGKTLHEQLANYFKERAHIEDMYAKSITKAFQKHFVADTQALGTFTAPWEKLSAESSELASLHGQLSLRISNEIERPLRDYARIHPEWQNLPLAETNCIRIAKEFDEKQAKVTKYTRAVEKVSGKKAEAAEQKLMDYTKQLESTRTAWRLEGPVILQKYQDVDQGRLEHLKQTVTAFEAMQTETVLLIAEMSGRTSSSVAEFDPLMDMELFTSEVSVNMHSVVTHDSASLHSNHSHPSNGDAIGSLETRRSDGTHKRGLTGSSQLSNMSFSTDRSVPQSKAASVDHTKTIDTMDHARSGSSVLGSALDVPTNHVDAEGFTIPPPDHGPWSDAGMSSNYDDEHSETSSFSQAPKMHLEIRQDSVTESNDEARAALERVTSTLKQTKTASRRRPGRREVRSMYQSEDSSSAYNSFQSSPLSTGFTDATRDAASTPPAMHSPGSRLFFNHSATHLQPNAASFSPATSRASTLGLPSVSNSSYPTSSPSQQMIPPTPPLSLVNGGSGTTSLAPVSTLGISQSLVAEPDSLTPTSPQSPMAPNFTTEESAPHTNRDSHGVAVAEGGQNKRQVWVASVIEKVHAHTQAGEISKMMVTGEVILTLEDTLTGSESESGAIADTDADDSKDKTKKALLRLDNLQGLEKHIPNPAYLTVKEGAEGSYWVNLESLSQAMHSQQQHHAGHGQGQGVVVLKYQVKTTEEDAKQKTMIPLLVHPAWKCEPHQTSLLINYKANVNCKLASRPGGLPEEDSEKQECVQLTELSFLMPVSGEVTSVQSRPTGIWNSDSNKMLWDVDSVVMSSGAAEPHKLLARFELNTGAGSGPSHPSATAVKFRVQGRLLSDLVVSLEKEKENEEEREKEPSSFGSVRLQVQSGRYLAMP